MITRNNRPAALFVIAILIMSIAQAAAASAAPPSTKASASAPTFVMFAEEGMSFRFLLPTDWSFVKEKSDDRNWVFYGPNEQDYAYVELYTVPESIRDSMKLASALAEKYGAELPAFSLVSGPVPIRLGGTDAAIVVYSFTTTSGIALKSVEVMAVIDGGGYSMTVRDTPKEFDARLSVYDAMLSSLVFLPTERGMLRNLASQGPVAAKPVASSAPSAPAPAPAPAPTYAPGPPPDQARIFSATGGQFTIKVPAGAEIWEHLSTAHGDKMEPYFEVFNQTDRAMSQTVVLWQYFDPSTQKEIEYEVLIGVIENAASTLDEAVRVVWKGILGRYWDSVNLTQSRAKVGTANGMRVYVDDLSWTKTVDTYITKSGRDVLFIVADRAMDPAKLKELLDSMTVKQ
ncbi:MAG: hypothetical protein NUW23_01880 [Firmicutes bacterium]|jgi:hypothetical protein|nr:hypothetical protein [Bacillota bacterium]